jgi:ankyrin repeat protein
LYDAKNYYGVIAESRAGQYMMSEHNVVGLAFYATNQFADAIRVFSESETGFPNEPVIKSNLGDALFSNRQPVEALAKYREALALNPNNPSFKQRIQQAQQAVNNLRRNTQSSRLTEDIKSSSTTRETNPNNFVPYYTLNDLMDAIDKSDQTKVDFLLGKGIEINQLNSAGRTPLIAAIRNDDLNMVKHLLDRGADPNMRGSDGYSPIIRAKTAIKPNAEIIQLLKSVGAFDPFSVPK